MGVFGVGLYSGDFAMDLRSAISAVVRLPFDSDQLVEILSETEPNAANNRDDQDHSTFWLVTADQFVKRAILSDRVRQKALAIIDSGADLAMLQKLGMNPSDLRKREKMLKELRERITAPPTDAPPRTVLKKPQAFVMDIGDVFVYPTFGGRCRNAYFASKESDRMGTAMPAWKQDGWSAMLLVDRGRAFDFLAWYVPLTVTRATAHKPMLDELRRGELLWRLANPGTCSPVHFKRMEFEKIGALPVDDEKLRRTFPGMRPGTRAAISDISLCNGLSIAPHTPEILMPKPGEPLNYSRGRPFPTILGVGQILSD
jgi:hypothetical protein